MNIYICSHKQIVCLSQVNNAQLIIFHLVVIMLILLHSMFFYRSARMSTVAACSSDSSSAPYHSAFCSAYIAEQHTYLN